jgi:hypothetical protein
VIRAAAVAVLLLVAGCGSIPSSPQGAFSTVPATSAGPGGVPRFDHVVIVVEENHSATQVQTAPYLTQLAGRSAQFTNSHAVTHPSEPNYLALWSGSTHKLTNDSCPHTYRGSLGEQLLTAGRTVSTYQESMPSPGYTGCTAGLYARKHNPLANFTATAGAAHNQPFTAWPTDFTKLPDVSLVVPNLADDMHNGTVAAGDLWLQTNIGPYEQWTATHNSLLIVTWDENDGSVGNQILTLFAGAGVRAGSYPEPITHYNVLHTVEAAFGLPLLGPAAAPVSDAWTATPTPSPTPSGTPTVGPSPSPTGQPVLFDATGHGWRLSGTCAVPGGANLKAPCLDGPRWPAGRCHPGAAATGQPLPDPACTPGAVDGNVTESNIGTTICQTGYTSPIRPPQALTAPAKLQSIRAYGDTTGTFEYDHLVPLEMGGASDTRNLWPEPAPSYSVKDKVENAGKAAVCSGKVTLRAAQQAIAADWVSFGRSLGVIP